MDAAIPRSTSFLSKARSARHLLSIPFQESQQIRLFLKIVTCSPKQNKNVRARSPDFFFFFFCHPGLFFLTRKRLSFLVDFSSLRKRMKNNIHLSTNKQYLRKIRISSIRKTIPPKISFKKFHPKNKLHLKKKLHFDLHPKEIPPKKSLLQFIHIYESSIKKQVNLKEQITYGAPSQKKFHSKKKSVLHYIKMYESST